MSGLFIQQNRKTRARALARARRCLTCRMAIAELKEEGIGRISTEPCLGCGCALSYYSCAPGYCRACAHDPGWQRLEDVL